MHLCPDLTVKILNYLLEKLPKLQILDICGSIKKKMFQDHFYDNKQFHEKVVWMTPRLFHKCRHEIIKPEFQRTVEMNHEVMAAYTRLYYDVRKQDSELIIEVESDKLNLSSTEEPLSPKPHTRV